MHWIDSKYIYYVTKDFLKIYFKFYKLSFTNWEL